MVTTEHAERYREIIDEIKDLLSEAKRIVSNSESRTTRERARGYCHAHIATALDDDHEFLGNSMFTMEKIANELDSQASDSEEDDGEDESEENDGEDESEENDE